MLDLVLIFLITTITSIVAVRIYRYLSRWPGFNTVVVGRTQPKMTLRIAPQEGFVTLSSDYQKDVGMLRLRATRGAIRSPWGW